MHQVKIIRIEKTNSSNDYLKSQLESGNLDEGSVVVTKSQVKGRGMGSNSWESETGKNLTLSLLIKPHFIEASEMFLISKMISLGLVSFLNNLKNEFTIKWPNDIYWKNKKVCGILIENQLLGSCLNYSIIGIGLNVNQDTFISNAPNPASLKQIFNKDFDLEICLQDILESIFEWYYRLANDDIEYINQSYFNLLFRNKGYYLFKTKNETFKAKINAVENNGLLKLETTNNEFKSFYFKEVEFVF